MPLLSLNEPAPRAPAKPVPSAGPSGFRWVICGLLFFSVALNYVDRQIIGILKQPLSRDLGWSERDYATIVAWFQAAYAFGYLFGGRLMDRLGVKRGLPIAVLLWSAACAAHGLVRSVAGFGFSRSALGLAEGGNFPGAIKAIAEWFPAKERALATGIFNCGTNLGAIICPLTVPWMALRWGWPSTFFVTGALGAGWVVAWIVLYGHSGSDAAPAPSSPGASAASASAAPALAWFGLLRFRAVWAYVISGLLVGPVWPFYLFFLPDFLQKRYGLSQSDLGLPVALFYLLASFGGVAGGWLPARLIARGWTLNAARKVSLLVCALAALPVCLAPYLPHLWVTVLVVGLAGSAQQGWASNIYSLPSDTMPKSTVSSIVGMNGFVSFLAGGLAARLVGRLLEVTGGYGWIFAAVSLIYLLALAIVQLLVPRMD